MKKKKYILLTMFIALISVVAINTKPKEVDAAENCHTYWNYYLFLEASNRSGFDRKFASDGDPFPRKTWKEFPLGIPAEAKNISHGPVKINDGDYFNYESTEFSLNYFYESYKDIEGGVDDDSLVESYAIAKEWFDETGNPTNDNTPLNVSYEEFKSHVPFDNHYVGDYRYMTNAEFEGMTVEAGMESFSSYITRTFSSSDLSGISSGTVWSPAAYYIKYDLCSGTPDEDTYSVTVKYVDKDTNEELPGVPPFTLKDQVPVTEEYDYDCADKTGIPSNYKLFEDATHPSIYSGDGTDGDQELICYYEKLDEPEYNVEQYYYDEENNLIREPDFQKDPLTNDLLYLKNDENYTEQCPSTVTADNLTYTFDHANPKTGTIKGADGRVDCYYNTTYSVTIKFGSDEDCTNELKNPSIGKEEVGTSVKVEVDKKISGHVFTAVGNTTPDGIKGTISDTKNIPFTFTMPNEDVEICLVYTPQTGSGLIYLAWIIGAGALGYSIYYFSKNNKKQENEI